MAWAMAPEPQRPLAPQKSFTWRRFVTPSEPEEGGKWKRGIRSPNTGRRLSFSQLIRNAVLAARKDSAPQFVGPSRRVYRGMSWGLMSVDHPVRKTFITIVEWQPRPVRLEAGGGFGTAACAAQGGPSLCMVPAGCVGPQRAPSLMCGRGQSPARAHSRPTGSLCAPAPRRPWFDRIVLVLILANCGFMASKARCSRAPLHHHRRRLPRRCPRPRPALRSRPAAARGRGRGAR